MSIGEPQACPYLGLPDDPRTRFTFATPAHRCHVKKKPDQIDLGHQGAYCLSGNFAACDRYRAPAAANNARTEPALAVAAMVAPIPEPEPIVPPPAPIPEPEPIVPPPAPVVTAPVAAAVVSVRPPPSWSPAPAPAPAPIPEAPAAVVPPAPIPEAPPVPVAMIQPPAPAPPPVVPPPAPVISLPPPVAAPAVVVAAAPPPVVPPAPITPPPTPVADLRSRLEAAGPTGTTVAAASAPPPSAAAPSPTASAPSPSEPRSKPPGARRRRLSVRRRWLLLLVLLAAVVLLGGIATGALRAGPEGGILGAIATAPATPAAGVPSTPFVEASIAALPAPTPSPSPSPLPTATPTPIPTPTATPSPKPVIYVVKAGDSLTKIAARFGVTPQAIRRANHLKSANLLQVGQKLIIPTKG